MVTVAIPTHNRCQLLKEAVASVRAQTFKRWELVIVDDASEDETWEWLQTLSDPRIRPIRLQSHAQQSACRNAGLRAARGRFLLFLDDDDLLRERALEVLVGALERHPQAIAAVGGFTAFDPRGARKTHSALDPVRPVALGKGVDRVESRTGGRVIVRTVWQDILFGWRAVSGQCLMRIDVVRSINGWNEAFLRATDHELLSRFGRLGPFALVPDIVLRYRVHHGQWRPRNLDQLMSEAREVAVKQTQGSERRLGERTLRARTLALRAGEEFDRGNARRASALYLKALWLVPELLGSPVSRPVILRPLARCLAAVVGGQLGRRLFRRRVPANGRIDFSMRAIVESDKDYPEVAVRDVADPPARQPQARL